MTDFKLFGKCFRCKLRKWAVWKREVILPGGTPVISRALFCTPCSHIIKSAFKRGIMKDNGL